MLAGVLLTCSSVNDGFYFPVITVCGLGFAALGLLRRR
jgi:hypothetical protein